MRFCRNAFPSKFLLFAFVICFLAVQAMAGPITIFTAQDDGAPIGSAPNSLLAHSAFAAAAATLSPMGTITFENLPDGFFSSFAAAPDVNITVSAPDFGSGFSGIQSASSGNMFGFNITPGGSKWFGFPDGSATFNFANPTEYFGFWYTGVQTIFTSSITVSFNDGSAPQTYYPPINVAGGTAFFGFTDPGGTISQITIENLGNDAWGIDDVQYNSVPEPATLLLIGGGLLAVTAFVRRKR